MNDSNNRSPLDKRTLGLLADDSWMNALARLACAAWPLIVLGHFFMSGLFTVAVIVAALLALGLLVRWAMVATRGAVASERVDRAVGALLMFPYWLLLCTVVFQAAGARPVLLWMGYGWSAVCALGVVVKAYASPRLA